MVKSLNDAVLEKVDEIVKYIEESDSYIKFEDLSRRLEKDSDIMDKINKVKSIQKEMVKLEIERKDISYLEKEVEDVISSLSTYPIYQEYNYLFEDLDNTFQEVKFIIENYLNNKIN